jgi:hypothetical protein
MPGRMPALSHSNKLNIDKMKLITFIKKLFRQPRLRRVALLANEAHKIAVTLFLPNQLSAFQPGEDHWVQLSPFGDFGNINGKSRIIQRFRKEDAQHICNEFNSTIRRVTQPLGMPFYIGHPDHPRFVGQPGHEDTRAYGRGKEMQVRHDAACPVCAAFANTNANANAATDDSTPVPCQDHGLFVKMHWNDDGARLISNESFHGHSVNWAAVPDAMENGVQVYRPVRVKSAGFTNEPNIPVRPASLANAADTSDDEQQPAQPAVPPRLKLIAGFKEDEDVTMEQVIEALEKAHPVDTANESLIHLEEQLANERRSRATLLVDALVKSGKVITKDRPACIEQLCNAGDKFDETAADLGNAHPAVKTEPRTRGLAGQHAKVVEGERERTARFQQLMDTRQRDFPNETYEDRFRTVANSNEGAQLFAQMTRPGTED